MALSMDLHKAGFEAAVSPREELKWGARDLTGPGLEAPSLADVASGFGYILRY